MRSISEHTVSGDQAVQLNVNVLDGPGPGGACHEYAISWDGPVSGDAGSPGQEVMFIKFQNGPIKEFGINGVTQEALLVVVIDRLRSFQAGPFSCRENAIALTHIEEALMWLHRRTAARIERGVEGPAQK